MASWSPQADEVLLLEVVVRDETTAVSNVAGNGLTWTLVADVDNARAQMGVSLFRASSSSTPSVGAVTFDHDAGDPVRAILTRISGADISTTDGVEAVGTAAGPPVTDDADMIVSVTTVTDNALALAFGGHRGGQTFTAPTGETIILSNTVDCGGGGDRVRGHYWREDGTVSPAGSVQLGDTGDLSGAEPWAVIGVSIKPAPVDVEAALTGVSATPAVGTVDVEHDQALSGVEATPAVGSVTPSTTVDLSGVEATPAVGNVAVSADVEEALTGVESPSAVGFVGVLHDQALSGVEATPAVGSVTPSTTVDLSGVEATPEVGSVGFTKSGSVELSGVEAVSAVGTVGIAESGEVALVGVESPSAVDTVGVEHDQALAGVESPSAVGSVGVLHDQDLSGVEATPAVGSVTPSTTVELSGVEAVSAVGNVAVPGAATLTGVEATTAVDSVGVVHDQALSGVEILPQVGSVTPSTTIELSGVEATPAVGDVAVPGADVQVALTGVEATPEVGCISVIIREIVCISVDEIFDRVMENGETFGEALLLIRANAAGSIAQLVDGSYKIKSADGAKNRIEGDDAANNGRDITATDVT